MNRKALKALAKKQVEQAGKSARLVTLVFLIFIAAITLLSYAPELLNQIKLSGSGYLSHRMSILGMINSFSYVYTLLLSLINLLALAGYAVSSINVLNYGSTTLRDLLGGTRRVVAVVVMSILKTLYCALWCYLASLIPISMLLYYFSGGDLDVAYELAQSGNYTLTIAMTAIVAVLYFLIQYRYRLSLILLMEQPTLSPAQAIRRSVIFTKGHRFQLLLLDLSFLPWYLLCALTCGILLIWKLPYFSATWVAACHSLIAGYEAKHQGSSTPVNRYPDLPEHPETN